VNFIQGEAAKLNWSVDVGVTRTWASVEIRRGLTKESTTQRLLKRTTSSGTTVYLTVRTADMDLDIKSTLNIVNVTFVLRNLARTTDEMFYHIAVVNDDFESGLGKHTKLNVYGE
jgi:hypothetical protein